MRYLTENPTKSQLILKKHRDNELIDCSLVWQKHGTRAVRKIRSIYDLPEEVLAEILKYLPVKYILRCRCVQKSWYSLVRTRMFVTLQLNYQKERAIIHHPKYLFFENAFMRLLTLRFDDVECQKYCKIKFLPGLPYHSWYAVSHGLICASPILSCFDQSRNIYMWNPLVQKYKTLPDSPLTYIPQTMDRDWEALAFGFLPEINDYVVVHIFKPRFRCQCASPHSPQPDFFEPDSPPSCNSCEPNSHSVIISVYSLNTNSWKKFSQDNVFIIEITSHDVAFVNGVAFWVGHTYDYNKIIMCFDTKTDILRQISLPDWLEDLTCTILYPFGQSIAYFVVNRESNHFDMWILEGDPMNKFSWEKKVSVTLSKDVRVQVLGMRNNGEPIFIKSYSLLSYNLDNNEPSEFVSTFEHWDPFFHWEEGFAIPYLIIPFTETLVLLDID